MACNKPNLSNKYFISRSVITKSDQYSNSRKHKGPNIMYNVYCCIMKFTVHGLMTYFNLDYYCNSYSFFFSIFF